MDLKVPEGKYLVGVSGGVDSMVLLDILTKQAKSQKLKAKSFKPSASSFQLVVAHFNHGIRPDSGKDEEFVRQTAEKYELPFEVGHGKLGPDASEEQARKARYRFLNKIKQKYKAGGIVTAHHQDDLIETAFLNILRGTGRRGLTAIGENPDIIRPLLHLSKKDILAHAKAHKLKWREDPTNRDEKYLRNFIRLKIVPRLSETQRRQFLQGIRELRVKNRLINQEVENLSQKIVKGKAIERSGFIALPAEIAREVLMHFLRQNNIRNFDKKTVERLMVAIKTAKAGTTHDVIREVNLEITRSSALLE
ncbi:tRNA lysidine(34) synthetase TilS [Candidatus Saccharibacteria bacterium]|nr:tRNA lysidine(34) synthetase TilS [Candidatus Saccharibacteria bacterium]